jgi:hypothetical protein
VLCRPLPFSLPFIHRSVPWPGTGHPEVMKMELPPRLFSHQCLEDEFSEVELPLYGVLRSSIAEVCLATFGRRARSYKSRQGMFSSLTRWVI